MAAIFNTLSNKNITYSTGTGTHSDWLGFNYTNATPWTIALAKPKEEKVTLFTYAVVYQPQDKEDGKPTIVIVPTHVLAKSEDAVKKIAARAIPPEYSEKLDDCKVLVRPF